MPSELLILELTESAIADDPDAAAESLGRLERIGVSLHMDDFGTGFSSLGMLRRLPFGAVKIDRGAIADIAAIEDDALLVEGIVGMAHSLHKVVIAEGVETEAQAALLRRIDCDRAQGWLFGRPMAAAEIALRLVREGPDAAPAPGGPDASESLNDSDALGTSASGARSPGLDATGTDRA